MNSERDSMRKTKEHLLPVRLRTKEPCPSEGFLQAVEIVAAKYSFFAMQRDRDHLLADARIPLPAEIFDFSKFRHRSNSNVVLCRPCTALVPGIEDTAWLNEQ